jgi:hypothetical protein
MTEHLALEYGGFPSLEDYLRGYAVVGNVLAPLTVPTRIISADDDPIIPSSDLAHLPRLRSLEITRTPLGGHCGYFDGIRGGGWLERMLLATLESRTR